MVAIIILTIVAGYLLAFWILKKPFSKLSEKVKWSIFTPKVQAVATGQNLPFLEEFHRKVALLSHEEKCIIIQEIFGKDVKIIIGLDTEGKFWIDGVMPYNYGEMIGSFMQTGGGEE